MPSRQVSWWGALILREGTAGVGTRHQALSHGLCPLAGLRILLVDQWVETGGTMQAAIQLVERLGGVVAGRRGGTRAPQGAPMGAAGPPSPSPAVALLCFPAGVAAICIEDSEGGRWLRERYKCSHCVPPRLQPRFDHHQLGWD